MGFFERVTQAFRGPKPAPGVAGAQVLPNLPLWEQFQRIGGSLTPRDVSSIIRQADTGDLRRLIDLANDMRQKDGQLHCTLQTREMALATLEWDLTFPGQGRLDPTGKEQREFVENTLRAHPELNTLIAHLQGAVYYGHAVAETQWGVTNGKLVPLCWTQHAPRRFGYRQTDGTFVWRDDNNSFEGIEFQTKWPDKFIVSHPRVNGDIRCREGLARVLMWLALFRNWAISDWLKLAEIAWKPWRVGRYGMGKDLPKASKEDVESLGIILRDMTASGSVSLPESIELDLKWPAEGVGSGNNGTHDSLISWAGSEMTKAVLGQTLTTEQGRLGSLALGKVHNEIRKGIIEADASHIGCVLTKMLVEPMVRLNYGPNAPVPQFRFITDDTVDVMQFSQAIKFLREPGVSLPIPARWVRGQIGIPEPEEGDELVGDFSPEDPAAEAAEDSNEDDGSVDVEVDE